MSTEVSQVELLYSQHMGDGLTARCSG